MTKVATGQSEKMLTPIKFVYVEAQPAITTSLEYFDDSCVVIDDDALFRDQFVGIRVPATEKRCLVLNELEEGVDGVQILSALGDKAEIAVSQFNALLVGGVRTDPNGERYRDMGAEFRKYYGEWLLFHLKGKNGKLLPVTVYWCNDKACYCYHTVVQKPDFVFKRSTVVVTRL